MIPPVQGKLTNMTNKERLRPGQLIWILIPLIVATGIDLVPASTSTSVGRAGWISLILAGAAWLPFQYMHLRLGEYAGGRSLARLAEEALGRWPGKALGLMASVFFLHLTTIVLWEAGDFISLTLMPETPEVVIKAVTSLMIIWVVAQGAESLARSSEFYVPVAILTFFLILLLSSHEMDLRNLLPIPDASTGQLVMGIYVPLALFAEMSILAALWPVLPPSRQIRRVVWLSYAAILGILLLDTVATVATFGPELAAQFRFPLLQVTKMISVLDFLERLDAAHAAIWFGGITIKASVALLASLLLLRDVLGIKDYRTLAFPVGALLLPLSLSDVNDAADFQVFVEMAPPYFLIVNVVLPALVLATCRLRKISPQTRSDRQGETS